MGFRRPAVVLELLFEYLGEHLRGYGNKDIADCAERTASICCRQIVPKRPDNAITLILIATNVPGDDRICDVRVEGEHCDFCTEVPSHSAASQLKLWGRTVNGAGDFRAIARKRTARDPSATAEIEQPTTLLLGEVVRERAADDGQTALVIDARAFVRVVVIEGRVYDCHVGLIVHEDAAASAAECAIVSET